MSVEPRLARARELMLDFERRTGLADPALPPRRYLWTDAFAVCNELEFHRLTGDGAALERALSLVAQVHQVLGRHRADDPREGWINGLSEVEGREHPTRGGLRIGKPRAERGPREAYDSEGEWDRDGQYFHYSTKWMHALARVADVTGDERTLDWAIELALATHAGFASTDPATGDRRLIWKASIDLSRPLVPSMGQHDALDGLLTFRELRTVALRAGRPGAADALEFPTRDLRALAGRVEWATADPLGVGGLLVDAYRLVQLIDAGDSADAALLPRLVQDAARSLEAVPIAELLRRPPATRLAFRELGLAIGLHAAERLLSALTAASHGDLARIESDVRGEQLRRFLPLAGVLENTWLESGSRATAAWQEHADINSVMLATSLVPGGFLAL